MGSGNMGSGHRQYAAVPNPHTWDTGARVLNSEQYTCISTVFSKFPPSQKCGAVVSQLTAGSGPSIQQVFAIGILLVVTASTGRYRNTCCMAIRSCCHPTTNQRALPQHCLMQPISRSAASASCMGFQHGGTLYAASSSLSSCALSVAISAAKRTA